MQFKKLMYKKILFLIILCTLLLPLSSVSVFANDEIDELNDKIDDKKEQLEQLNKEIEEAKKLVNQTSGQASTLQSKINSLEASRKKLEKEIKQTKTQIEKTELTLQKIGYEISDKEQKIQSSKVALGSAVKEMHELNKTSIIEKILSYSSINEFWNQMEYTEKIQAKLRNEVNVLLDLSADLRDKESEKSAEKSMLAQAISELGGEHEAVQSTKTEQQQILSVTKNKEAEYKKMLADKVAQKAAFEKELLDIESKIKYLIDPKSFPTAKTGIFSYPVDNIIITQLFGGSEFAKQNPGIYGRAYHPGVDFGVPVGTKVKSIGDGVVEGSGNTDAYPGCKAWGKWILVRHTNGLTSLYAHLSSVIAATGQTVKAGDTIALSGNTGISTGPHLHLTIYASQGVKIGAYSSYKSGSGCAATGATGPFADLAAYLDPMSYLPK